MTLTPASLWHPTPAGFQRFGRSGIVIPSDGPPPINYTATDDVTITVKPTGAQQNIYRPISITSPSQLPNAPTNANYVTWPYATPQTVDLQTAFDALGANDILVLPENPMPYQVDSSSGFLNNQQHYFDMCRPKRGIVGMGPGTIVQTSPSSFTAPRQTGSAGMVETVIYSNIANAYFGNFEMRGGDFGDRNNSIGYNGLKITGNNTIVERCYFNAAHRGFKNAPPGEAGAVIGFNGSDQKVLNCEVECRDSTGTRVGSSPVMWNNQLRPVEQDLYLHHSIAGMPTWYGCTDGTATRVRSEFNGSGSGGLNGSCRNFELNKGTFNMVDCTFLLGYGANSGLHFSVGSNNGQSIVVNVTRPKFGIAGGDTSDAPFANPPRFSIQYQNAVYPNFSQNDSDFHFRDANNQPIPFMIAKSGQNPVGPFTY